MSNSPERVREVLDLVAQAQELLDQAVGRSVKLPVHDRELMRQYLLPPRNHLRGSADAFRQKVEAAAAEAQVREKRREG